MYLTITEISLAQVTEGYLRYIETQEVPPSELADFLIVATKLLLIKSQAILPVEQEVFEDDSSKLALQLRLYKEFVDASKILEDLFMNTHTSFERAQADLVKVQPGEIVTNVTSGMLQEAFAGLLKRLEPFFKLQTAALDRVVSVKERLQEIHQAILARANMTFRQIASGGKSKVDIVVSFLALLELVKQQIVHVVQGSAFEEIEIKRVD